MAVRRFCLLRQARHYYTTTPKVEKPDATAADTATPQEDEGSRLKNLEDKVEKLAEQSEKYRLFQAKEELQDKIKYASTKSVTVLNIDDVVEYCKLSISDKDKYSTYLFVHRELKIRTARAIVELNQLPNGYPTMPSARKVRDVLIHQMDRLFKFPRPDQPQLEEKFNTLLKDIDMNQKDIMLWLGMGLHELKTDIFNSAAKPGRNRTKREVELVHDLRDLQEGLNRFYAGRISVGFLVKQHLSMRASLKRPKGNYVGLVNTKTNLYDVCKGAMEDARDICTQTYGGSPLIILKRKSVKPFEEKHIKLLKHIPAHLQYILFELLKNSLRATKEKHENKSWNDMPPVMVTVTDHIDCESVSVKISDQGGGIPHNMLPHVMSYMYTTAGSSMKELLDDATNTNSTKLTPMAGFGVGLPISRLYAQHFGGDLRIFSLEGYGTDVFLHLGLSLENPLVHIQNSRHSRDSYSDPYHDDGMPVVI